MAPYILQGEICDERLKMSHLFLFTHSSECCQAIPSQLAYMSWIKQLVKRYTYKRLFCMSDVPVLIYWVSRPRREWGHFLRTFALWHYLLKILLLLSGSFVGRSGPSMPQWVRELEVFFARREKTYLNKQGKSIII